MPHFSGCFTRLARGPAIIASNEGSLGLLGSVYRHMPSVFAVLWKFRSQVVYSDWSWSSNLYEELIVYRESIRGLIRYIEVHVGEANNVSSAREYNQWLSITLIAIEEVGGRYRRRY